MNDEENKDPNYVIEWTAFDWAVWKEFACAALQGGMNRYEARDAAFFLMEDFECRVRG